MISYGCVSQSFRRWVIACDLSWVLVADSRVPSATIMVLLKACPQYMRVNTIYWRHVVPVASRSSGVSSGVFSWGLVPYFEVECVWGAYCFLGDMEF